MSAVGPTALETAVIVSVWVALFCYPAAALGRASGRPRTSRWLRRVWTAGCVAFGLHMIGAFGVFYGWSFAVAWAETARQTRETTGFDSGIGLIWNLVFALLWLTETVWWWRQPDGYRGRSRGTFLLVHGFMLFMILQGAVVFVSGPRRWLGMLVLAAATIATFHALRRPAGRRPVAEADGRYGR